MCFDIVLIKNFLLNVNDCNQRIWWDFVMTELAYIVLMGLIQIVLQSHVKVIFVGFIHRIFGNDF